MTRRDTASARISAPPEAVFRMVTDPTSLPAWNHAITEVVEAPNHLEPGSVWKVKLHALGQSWVSRSRVSALEPEVGLFAYRSQSDDGNPSYADWEWHIRPDRDGSMVTVSVELSPITFWRKHLLVRIRRPALRSEIRASLNTLGSNLNRRS